MVADFFTKPLQGMLFYKFRAIIMNLNREVLPDTSDLGSVLENEGGDEFAQKSYRLPVNGQKNGPNDHSSARI